MDMFINYKEFVKYFNKESTIEEVKEQIKLDSRRFAKRQYTFFNNQFDNIIWYDIDKIDFKDIVEKVSTM